MHIMFVAIALASFPCRMDDIARLQYDYNRAAPVAWRDIAPDRQDVHLPLPGPLMRSDLDQMRRELTLSDAQFAAVQRAFLDYVEQHNAYVQQHLAKVREAIDAHPTAFLRPLSAEIELPFRQQMYTAMRQHFDGLWWIEHDVYRQIEPALTDDQQLNLPRFVRWRQRQRLRHANDYSLPEAEIELRSILLDALQVEQLPAELQAAIDAYEHELDQILTLDFPRRQRWIRDRYRDIVNYQQDVHVARTRGDTALPDSVAMLRDFHQRWFNSSVTVRRHQEQARDALRAMLNPQQADAFELAYGRAVYPEAYERAQMLVPMLNAAIAATDDEAVRAIAAAYRHDERDVLRRWVALEQAWAQHRIWGPTRTLAQHRSDLQDLADRHAQLVVHAITQLAELIDDPTRSALHRHVRDVLRRLDADARDEVAEAWPKPGNGESTGYHAPHD